MRLHWQGQPGVYDRHSLRQNPFHTILLPLPRSFLCEFYHAIDLNRISGLKHKKITLSKLPISTEIKSLFQSFLPFISHSQEVPSDLVRLKMAEAAYALTNMGNRFHSTIFDFSRPNELTMLEVVSCPCMNELQWKSQQPESFCGQSAN